jgi:translation initiation factor IF-1
MRMLRTVLSALVSTVLVLGTGAALQSPADAASAPKRVITEQDPNDHQVGFSAFKLKGTVTEPLADGTFAIYAQSKVKLQKKSCGTCKWKVVKKLKTNDRGTFKTRIYAPRNGRWKWRVNVPASNGYGATKGTPWTLYFR